MFGLEARHIKTLIVRQPGANACESKTTRIETDGWYADLPEHAACAAASTPAPRLRRRANRRARIASKRSKRETRSWVSR